VICIKTVQARITKSLLLAAPHTLIYRDKISCSWVKRFPSNESVKEEDPPKRRYFAAIGSSSVKTVADRYRHAAYHNKHWWQAFKFINIDDLERSWIAQKGFKWSFSNYFWMQRTFQHWIATKRLEVEKDNLRTKFSALNVDFSSLNPDPQSSKRSAQAGVKDSYPPKSSYFSAIISCSVKTVADRHGHAAYHNNNKQ